MRIISGIFKGRKIKFKLPNGIRPTKDSVKESIFNILNNYLSFDNISVADICAGSGSLGLEALSRGAGKCSFIDNNNKSLIYIQQITEEFNIPKDSVKIKKNDAISYLRNVNITFDLVFIDPPYKSDLYDKLENLLEASIVLNDGGIIVVELPSFRKFRLPQSYSLLNEKLFGETKIIIAMYHKTN